jgi:hypothetical protein
MTDQEKRAREAVRRVLSGASHSLSKQGNRKFFRSHLEVRDVEFVIAAAREGNPDALKILQEHARGARRAGMNVPTAFHEFVWEYFIDGPPKAPPGPKPQEYGTLRDPIIRSLVKVVAEEFGLPIHRNPAHRNQKTGPISACALVAQEVRLSESRVEEIVADGKTD